MSFGNWQNVHLGCVTAAICLLLVPILSGCAQATPMPEPATITFVLPEVDTEYYEALASTFNESHPYITVELSNYQFEEGDVIAVSPFELIELLEQDAVLNLEPFIENNESFDRADFYPGTVEMFAAEGKTWAVPVGVDTIVMFYNQDLFDLYNVPYPQIEWTWDDFLISGMSMSDPDAGIFGYVSTPQANDPLMFVYQHGGRIFDDLQNTTRVTFDDPLTIEAVEWYVALINDHNVAPTPEQARRSFGSGNRGIFRAILESKAGMWVGMFSDRGGLTWPSEWYMRWGMLPLPRDAQSITGGMVEGYAISSQTEHPDACWLWVDFLSRQIAYRLAPARRSLAESEAYELHIGKSVATTVRASLESTVLIPPDLSDFNAALDAFFGAVDDAVAGDSTPGEAMRWAQEQAEQ